MTTSKTAKMVISGLYRGTVTADPALKLSLVGDLLIAVRGTLVNALGDDKNTELRISSGLNYLLKIVAQKSATKYDLRFINEYFPETVETAESVEIYRDVAVCDELLERWYKTNEIYINSPTSWSQSNQMLVEINSRLVEIILNHDLLEFKSGEGFNISLSPPKPE